MTSSRGEHTDVVTLGVLLASERALQKWVYASFLTIVLTAVSMGIAYGKMTSDISRISARVEEIRAEGSVPLQDVHQQLVLLQERMEQNSLLHEKLAVLVMENQDALARIEARIGIWAREKRKP